MPSSVRIAKGALVCDGAVLTGDITIGATTVIFPGAKIQCSEGAGPITIGSGCVVEEGATIVNLNPNEMHIGDGNLFEVGCTVYAKKVGDYNAFQPKCEVGRETAVPSGCTFGPTVCFDDAATLESNTSVFRLDGEAVEYRVQKRPRNAETNRAKVKSYGTALASQGKKYYLGKYNKLLPPTEEGDLKS